MVGFEMAPNYAEESRNPKRIAKAATFSSVIGRGVFYAFISYVFVTGWGTAGVAPGVNGQFEGKYGSAYYPLADRFVGSGLTTVLEALIITSSFACALAFYNTSSRYLYSLARERALPTALARTHPGRHSPVVASMAVTALVGVYVLGFTLDDSSTTAYLLKLGTWTPLLGVLGILGVQALVCVAIIRYFRTTAAEGFGTYEAHHVVRPEDWPVMPVAHLGFKLKPSGFFDGNPALDMPPGAAAHCHAHTNGAGPPA